jgi:hypothetical protein
VSKKPDKQRGDIEVRVDFIVKPKAGSMYDLSVKSQDKTLSLRDLKQKQPGGHSFKVSLGLGDKLRSLNKSRKEKNGSGAVMDNSVSFFFLCLYKLK